MTDLSAIHAQIRAFGAAYDYDTGYLTDLLAASPGAHAAFAAGMDMSSFRETLPLDAHFVARFAAMRSEDCGPCTQLTLRMAIEAGVDRSLLETLIRDPQRLPSPLRDVYEHARAVAETTTPDLTRATRILGHYGSAALAELGVCIAGSRLFPTLKRALLQAESCSILTLDF